MKKTFFSFIIILLTLCINTVYAEEEKTEVKLVKCDSASSIWVDNGGTYEIVRLIAFDESSDDTSEVSTTICNMISSSSKIEIETEDNSKDTYNRLLVWMYLDDTLLQESLISSGLGQVNYVTSDYKYLDNLCNVQKEAIINKKGIWSSSSTKEVYCNSGIETTNEEDITEEETVEENNINTKDLWYLVFLSSGILLLILLYRGVYKHGIK